MVYVQKVLDQMSPCVVIPVYNEGMAIAALVRQIRQQGLAVIVVDDGSSDGTSRLARDSGATVLANATNRGKGASLIQGFRYALAQGFDAVVTIDGDGQHDPEDIPAFLNLARASGEVIFIGNRMRQLKNMPWLRRTTNKFMSWLISQIAGQKISDTQCGFRLFKKELLAGLRLKTSKYETESEILIRAARLGFRIVSVPIKTIYRGEKSQINPLLDTWRFLKLVAQESLWIRPS